ISEVSDAYCGLAWLTPGAASAYSSIVRSCAISNLSFPHEIGHNLGARHDRYVDPSSSTTAYNFGYVDTAARVRTIMAYNNACSDAG
ncbi:M12 family metallo-peptidase, partial [Salmonella enterica]|uniref:M12 family metallo-peptidase n=1 Tax=Salmonella enterica TaxID=28901 RepID=UPI003D2D1C34